jgi:tyrosyl-tRNA synthetase
VWDKIPVANPVHSAKLWLIFANTGEVNRMAASGGLYLNGKRVNDPNMILSKDNLLKEKFCVIGMGKTEKKILYLLPQPKVPEYLTTR